VLALRGVRRLRDLWKRLGVREDEDVRILLNLASRRREIQPDLARKVIGGRMAETTLPADFPAFEAAVNTGAPSRVEESKLRGAMDSLVNELEIMPTAEAERDGAGHRGLLGRLAGERGQVAVEFGGVLPLFLLLVIVLWQVGLTGYTYVVAGHAAREGARKLAVDPTDGPKEFPYRDEANAALPKPWRHGSAIDKTDEVTVKVSLRVPMFLPGVASPWHVTTKAVTSVEDEDLPASQAFTPTPTPKQEPH
jgi:pilus assembly protein CpaE